MSLFGLPKLDEEQVAEGLANLSALVRECRVLMVVLPLTLRQLAEAEEDKAGGLARLAHAVDARYPMDGRIAQAFERIADAMENRNRLLGGDV